MLPYRETNCLKRIGRMRGLREQPREIAAEHIAAAPLRQTRIAGGIHKNPIGRPADERLVAL